MNHADDVLEAIREYLDEDLPHYTDSLVSAFAYSDPVFTRKRYGEFFWHCASTVPGWLAQVVMANAQAESEGSTKLLSLWQSVHYNDVVEDRILFHAKDESRHSRLFLELVQLAFPNSIDQTLIAHWKTKLPDIRRQSFQKSAQPIPEDQLIDHLVQMNIGEIRTRIHMYLLAPVIHAFTPAENKSRVEKILQGLVLDEVRHIGYTARLMEQWSQTGDAERVRNLYKERLWDFHLITIEQTENTVRQYGQGRFPDLLEI